MAIDETIRRNLIEFRQKNKLTQDDIARQLNMPRSTYATYEQGYVRPGVEVLIQLSEIYMIPLTKLIGMKQEGENRNATTALPDRRPAHSGPPVR